MRIHSICVVRNEADIIERTLRSALEWSDFIYVFDNGSTDGTWEKVQLLRSDRLIPWKSDDKPFRESLRSEVFNYFRGNAESGDWWCRLDGDEIYEIESPKRFLEQVPSHIHVVWGVLVEYYITQKDLASIDFDVGTVRLLDLLRHYRVTSSEARFFRHRPRLEWPNDAAWPRHMGLVNPERILLKHYKYRSPHQTQVRLDTRRRSRERGFVGWEHASSLHWKEQIAAESLCSYDDGSGRFHIDSALLPRHIEPIGWRLLKRVLHGTGIWP